MHDPKLLCRLDHVRIRPLVIWGNSDRIAEPAYGRAYAAAFRDARFEFASDMVETLWNPEHIWDARPANAVGKIVFTVAST